MSLSLCGLWSVDCKLTNADILDSYLETFDGRQDGVTIHGVDSWSVSKGDQANAATQSGVTFSGSGKSLKLTGALTTTNVGRPKSYGALSPTWIHFSVKPSSSGQTPTVPGSGVGAVVFSHNGKILAASGSLWVDTGMSYTVGEWYDVAMKIDFKTHRYDLYASLKKTPKVQFVPVKSALKFIDASINSLKQLNFYGAYSTTHSGDVYIDDLSVTTMDRLEIVSSAQKLMLDQASSPIIIQLQNANSEPQTALSDMAVELKTTSPKGKFSLRREPWKDIAQIIIPKDSQSTSVYYKDTAVGKPLLTASEHPDQGLTDASQQQEITTKVSYFDIELPSAQLVAGQEFLMKITAKDDEGAINELFSGSVLIEPDYVSPQTGRYKISPPEALGFVRGKLELKASYPDAGLVTITIADKDSPAKTGTSSQILFLPASFTMKAEELQTVSKPFELSVTPPMPRARRPPTTTARLISHQWRSRP